MPEPDAPARPAFRLCSLASGSSGNAYYVESPDGALLVDAGLSGTRTLEAIRRVGGSPERVAGVVVTHDHRDHVCGAGVLHRKYGWPLFMSEGTWHGAASLLGRVAGRPGLFRPGTAFRLAGLVVEAHPTPHDAAEPVALVLARAERRAGVLTDLGHAFEGLGALVAGLDAVFLESNYNEAMLAASRRYPEPLKRRIRSPRGHLENAETGTLLRAHARERLHTVVLAHLSENNNRPDVALADVRAAWGEASALPGRRLGVAPRHAPSPWVFP